MGTTARGHRHRAPQLDHRGMVLDFSDIKHVVRNGIDDNLDHRMICTRTTRRAAQKSWASRCFCWT